MIPHIRKNWVALLFLTLATEPGASAESCTSGAEGPARGALLLQHRTSAADVVGNNGPGAQPRNKTVQTFEAPSPMSVSHHDRSENVSVVIVAITFVCLLPSILQRRQQEQQSASKTAGGSSRDGSSAVVDAPEQRDAWLDNARFVLVVMVVMNNAAQDEFVQAIRKVSWFHMPLFSLISGLVSERNSSQRTIVDSVLVPLLLPLFLLQCLYLPLSAFLAKGTWGIEIHLAKQVGPAWYLHCLIAWELVSFATHRLPALLHITVALGSGIACLYLPFVDRIGEFSWVRVLTLYPFFVIGQHLDVRRLKKGIKPSNIASVVFWVGCFSFTVFFDQVHNSVLEDRLLTVETFPEAFAQLSHSAYQAEYRWAFYLVDVALRLVQLLFFLLLCVPRREMFYTWAGRYIMYPYLLHWHTAFLLPAALALLKVPMGPVLANFSSPIIVACLRLCCYAALAFCVTSLLCTWPIRMMFSWLIEPTWALKLLPHKSCQA